MIDNTNKSADMQVGWAKGMRTRVASEDSIKNMGMTVDYWNPLWHDDYYAAGTKWGSIIAFPFYQERFGMSHFNLETTPE